MVFWLVAAGAAPYISPDTPPKVIEVMGMGSGPTRVGIAVRAGFEGRTGRAIGLCWQQHRPESASRVAILVRAQVRRNGTLGRVKLLEPTGHGRVDSCIETALRRAIDFRGAPYPETVKVKLGMPPAATPDASPLPYPELYTVGAFEQGPTYWIRTAPQTVVSVIVPAGSSDETSETRGLAHLVEHLAFRGTEHVGREKLDRFADRSALHSNAWTSADLTVYDIWLDDDEQLPDALQVAADWSRGLLSLEPDAFQAEQGIVLAEWRHRDTPSRRASIAFEAALRSSEQVDSLGTPESLEALTPEQARAFVERTYVPTQTQVVVSSRLDRAEVRELLQQAFDAPSTGAPANRQLPASRRVPDREAPETSVVVDPSATVARLTLLGQPIERPATHQAMRDYLRQEVGHRLLLAAFEIARPHTGVERPELRAVDLNRNQTAWAIRIPMRPEQQLEDLASVRDTLALAYDLLEQQDGVLAAMLTERIVASMVERQRLYGEIPQRQSAYRSLDGVVESFAGDPAYVGEAYLYDLMRAWLPSISRREALNVARSWAASPTGRVLLTPTAVDASAVEASFTATPQAPELNVEEALTRLDDLVSSLDRTAKDTPEPVAPTHVDVSERTQARILSFDNGLQAQLVPSQNQNEVTIYALRPGGWKVWGAPERALWHRLHRVALAGDPLSSIARQGRVEAIWHQGHHGLRITVRKRHLDEALAWLHALLDAPTSQRLAPLDNPRWQLDDLVEQAMGHPPPLSVKERAAAAPPTTMGRLVGDPGAWRVLFAGDLPALDATQRLVETYLGTLPQRPDEEAIEHQGAAPAPTTQVLERSVAGSERTSVAIQFLAPLPVRGGTLADLGVFADLVETALTEELRGRYAGVYTVGTGVAYENVDGDEHVGIVAWFTCAPEQAEAQSHAARATVARTAGGDWKDEDAERIAGYAYPRGVHPDPFASLSEIVAQWSRTGELHHLEPLPPFDATRMRTTAAQLVDGVIVEARLVPSP